MASSHDFINEAKQSQQDHLKQSALHSKQLQSTLRSLVQSNSTSSPLVDKIETIHALDASIDRQLNEEIAVNFESLKRTQAKLERAVNKGEKYLDHGNVVDKLQHRLEGLDMNIRILEKTLEFVQAHPNGS
ncbi:hypothetical protein DICA3_E15060 [Diutina catenulata]